MNPKLLLSIGVLILSTSGCVALNRTETGKPETIQEKPIATIYKYKEGKSIATTLYLDNIPFLIFLDSQSSSDQANNSLEIKQIGKAPDSFPTEKSRGEIVAARLNELYKEKVDPNKITVKWNGLNPTYTIQVTQNKLTEINPKTILAKNSNGDLAEDAITATNRLRDLFGGPPVSDAVRDQVKQLKGIASWYGPGFHGRLTANGEIFDQNAMTAAHKTLPFGTRVRVSNLDNGKWAMVRINDRGPYIPERVIDLSAEAARVLDMQQSGIATVQLEIVEAEQ